MSRSKLVFESPWISVEERIFPEAPSFNQHPYYLLHGTDGVYVLALTNKQEAILVRQFRPTTKMLELELVAGAVDNNEPALDAAKRELYEETGYRSNDWRALGFGYTAPERFCPKIYSFIALNSERDTSYKVREEIETVIVPIEVLQQKSLSGEFRQIAMLGTLSLAMWQGYLG